MSQNAHHVQLYLYHTRYAGLRFSSVLGINWMSLLLATIFDIFNWFYCLFEMTFENTLGSLLIAHSRFTTLW